MTVPVVRRLHVDLQTPLGRHWNGGDAFRTAFFNALSMSFPAGEQVFIDSMRIGLAALPPEQRERFGDEVQAFIGQEATHRRIHELFNGHLGRQGLVNRWEARIQRRRRRLEGIDPRNWLAVTAATEHFTAIFAEYLLAQPQVLDGAEPRLRDLWLWHSSEESEHRSTAFDLYLALGGNLAWRRRIFRVVSWHFVVDGVLQTVANLWRDGTWWRPSTWISGWRMLFGRQGLVRLGFKPWRRYLRSDFHPAQSDGTSAVRWLAEHATLAPPVRTPG
ncbi:MAG: metal-dependent hydrolase [Rubrivivax sp.]|nr:metal-dependent hydrolase [Rubrivivax sp.]